MSGGFPDAKPWASCWPRSDATTTLTGIPVFFDHAFAALLTANVSAGPDVPIRAVIVVADALPREPSAALAVRASAEMMTAASAVRQRVIRCECTRQSLLGAFEDGEGVVSAASFGRVRGPNGVFRLCSRRVGKENRRNRAHASLLAGTAFTGTPGGEITRRMRRNQAART